MTGRKIYSRTERARTAPAPKRKRKPKADKANKAETAGDGK